MSLEKKLDNYWKYLESKYSPPKYVGLVNELRFLDLKKAIDKKNIRHYYCKRSKNKCLVYI